MSSNRYPIPTAPPRYTDIRGWGWLPDGWLSYALLLRLDRPTGYWLLFLPAGFALTLNTHVEAGWMLWMLAVFLFGAVALRGAGCIINDFWDRELDRRVERTADRPLASGAISARRALVLFMGLIGVGVLVLLALPWRVWGWALASLPLIVLYPLAKRAFFAPQVILGLTFSWGVWLGWLAVNETLSAAPLWLYAGAFFWILYYDTIYACQDRGDDARLGLKSMPLTLGAHISEGLTAFAAATILCWAMALLLAGAGWLAWLGLGMAALWLVRQRQTLNIDDPAQCLAQFQGNARLGQMWLVLLVLSSFL